jgi:plastocyanin
MRHALFAFAVPVVLLVASACSPASAAGGPNAAPVAVTVKGTDDFRFNPATITVKAGQPLQVTFENDGQILHDFTVQQGLARAAVIPANGGTTGTAMVTFEKAGTYKFFCSQPGHDDLGMHGTITVTP